MIFILHYLLFNAGLPAIIILIALFLQTYSEASIAEIGALLMALPFVSILIKPLFCALADRRQAHKFYLMIALTLMALGYGSLAVAPFFPDLIREHGRLVWYLDVLGIVVGYSAFGVVWSLGDALAVNHAQLHGVPWGAYRVWGVVAWGGGGILIGQINELPFLPRYVPAMFVLLVSLLAEVLLLAVWPNEHFVMGGAPAGQTDELKGRASSVRGAASEQRGAELEDNWAQANGSLSGGTLSGGTARASPRMIGAVANIFMEDLSGTLRSSLRLGGRPRRACLEEILDEHQKQGQQQQQQQQPPPPPPEQQPPEQPSQLQQQALASTPQKGLQTAGEQSNGLTRESPALEQQQQPAPRRQTPTSKMSLRGAGAGGGGGGRGTLRRTQMALSRMNSLSAVSGHVIADELGSFNFGTHNESQLSDSSPGSNGATPAARQHQPVMYMSSLASHASFGKAAAAARALAWPTAGSVAESPGCEESAVVGDATPTPTTTPTLAKANEAKRDQLRSPDDLQLVLLKLIIRRDRALWKYLVMFTIFGALLTCHLSYFFVHLEHLCREKGVDFSHVVGGMMVAHSVSEVFSFTIVVPHFVPRLGRAGALLSCALIYAVRFAYYGTYLEETSPFTGIPFELAHGIAYGIVYSLITDIACECVNQVDLYIPELIERGALGANPEPGRLKLQLRATMQGLFSGAFDGLGNGLGALAGGLFLNAYPFTHLWRFCTCVCLVTLVVYPLTEWRSLCGKRPGSAHQKQPIF